MDHFIQSSDTQILLSFTFHRMAYRSDSTLAFLSPSSKMALPAHFPADLLIIVLTPNPPARPHGLVPEYKVPSPFPKPGPSSSAHLSASKRGVWDPPRTSPNLPSYVLASQRCCHKCLQTQWLKTTQLLTLQHRRLEALKAVCRHGWAPSQGSGEEPSSLGCLRSLALDPFPHLQSQQSGTLKHPLFACPSPPLSFLQPPSLTLTLLASSFKDPHDSIGPPGCFKTLFPVSRS